MSELQRYRAYVSRDGFPTVSKDDNGFLVNFVDAQSALAEKDTEIKRLQTFGVCPQCSCYVFGHATCDRCGAEAVPSVVEIEISKLVRRLAGKDAEIERLRAEMEQVRQGEQITGANFNAAKREAARLEGEVLALRGTLQDEQSRRSYAAQRLCEENLRWQAYCRQLVEAVEDARAEAQGRWDAVGRHAASRHIRDVQYYTNALQPPAGLDITEKQEPLRQPSQQFVGPEESPVKETEPDIGGKKHG